MRKMIIIAVVFVMFTTTSWAEKIPVAVSITPQKFFVERIAGDLAEITVMVPPGGNPHLFEPKPSQMVGLGKSRVYLAIGVPFEAAWLPRFQGANPTMRVVHTDHGIDKIPMSGHPDRAESTGGHGHGVEEAHGHGHDGGHDHGHGHGHAEAHHEHGQAHAHHEGEPDPHVWLSPLTVKTIAANIRDALAHADPAHAQIYADNFAAFDQELDTLHAEIKSTLSGATKRSFMVFHPAWGYFAQTYGLREIPIEAAGSEPSPRELSKLIRIAGEEEISAIFIQPQFSRKSAETIARQIGAEVVVADPLAEDWAANLLRVAESFRRSMD
jgi:zinc transport system substrate-binding protein